MTTAIDVEVWQDIVARGKAANAARTRSFWDLGDIAAEAETQYGAKTLMRLAEEIGVEWEALGEYRRVARAFEKSDRSDNLSWTHHRAVATLERRQRAKLLRDAERHGWSVNALSAKAHALKAKGRAQSALSTDGDVEVFDPYDSASQVAGRLRGLIPDALRDSLARLMRYATEMPIVLDELIAIEDQDERTGAAEALIDHINETEMWAGSLAEAAATSQRVEREQEQPVPVTPALSPAQRKAEQASAQARLQLEKRLAPLEDFRKRAFSTDFARLGSTLTRSDRVELRQQIEGYRRILADLEHSLERSAVPGN